MHDVAVCCGHANLIICSCMGTYIMHVASLVPRQCEQMSCMCITSKLLWPCMNPYLISMRPWYDDLATEVSNIDDTVLHKSTVA